MKKISFFTCSILIPVFSFCATWSVGASQTYTLPSQVRLLVNDGDTIYIDGGIYTNDATKWTKKNLKFIGLGTGNNRTILRYTSDIPNGKGIFMLLSSASPHL